MLYFKDVGLLKVALCANRTNCDLKPLQSHHERNPHNPLYRLLHNIEASRSVANLVNFSLDLVIFYLMLAAFFVIEVSKFLK